VSDLAIAHRMHLSYDEVLALPVDVYDVLIEELNKEPA
jgi:hypothetical protein